jgi:rare lipoprotein A
VTPSPVFIEKYKKQYVVKVGPFATKTMSDHVKLKLAQQGVKQSIVMLH